MGIRIGSPAPEAGVDYWIRGAHGPKRMTLAEHRGKWVVLFFYPRDFTFICPTELFAFGELEADFKAEEAVVIGASTDSFFSHKAWFESDARLLRVNYPVLAAPLNAAMRATNTIPIVVAACNDDMVETGIIASLAHPGGNVTRLSKMTPELSAKRLELLKEMVPEASRVAVLWD